MPSVQILTKQSETGLVNYILKVNVNRNIISINSTWVYVGKWVQVRKDNRKSYSVFPNPCQNLEGTRLRMANLSCMHEMKDFLEKFPEKCFKLSPIGKHDTI
uniref:Uncharacterized protein n=1 Tax=Micrurus spixii TaxID=129469 RepID=A0A2D4LME8_9SAUR